MASMEQDTAECMEEEETYVVLNEPGSAFLQDPLKLEEPSLHVKQDVELKLDMDGSERKCLQDPLKREEPSLHVKQDVELKIDIDVSERKVATSLGSQSDTTRLIQHSTESCYISSEETVKQEMVPGDLEIGAGESISFTMFGLHTELTEKKLEVEEDEDEEDNLFDPRLKCCLKETDFHIFSCGSCLQNFPSKYRLIMHVFIHINGVQPPTYVCKSCGQVFCSSISLNRHLKMSAGVQPPFNDHNYDIGPIYNHENMVEGNQEVSFMEQPENQSSNKETRRISRKFCNDNSNTHMRSNAEKGNRHDNYRSSSTTGNVNNHALILTYKCDRCDKSFRRKGQLKRHSLIHTGVKPHKCDVCGKSFTLLQDLKMHSSTHNGSKPHICDICGKSFTRLRDVKRHSLIHSGSKPHICDTCGKSFTWLGNLKQHSLIHTGSKPHKCDICGKSFTQWATLKHHSLIHTGSKPHKCNVCGKSFTQLGTLKNHSLIHTRSKPHNCNVCGKSFTLLGKLKQHSLIHT